METNSKPSQLRELFSTETIQHRVKELATQISKDYEQQELYVVGILKGAFIFMADLIRELDIPCRIHFLKASSYGDQQTSSGNVRIEHDLQIEGKHVLLIEDIVDTGLTMKQIINELQNQKPASLKICALLDKKEARQVDVEVAYIGFTIPNFFVVGYGLDCAECHRELPYIAEVCS